MKPLLNNRLEFTEFGKDFERSLERKMDIIFDDFISHGASPKELNLISNIIINKFILNSYDKICDKLNKLLTEGNDLKIFSSKGEEKSAKFSGIDKDGNKLWVYEQNWEPRLPYGIKDLNGNLFWFLYLNLEDFKN